MYVSYTTWNTPAFVYISRIISDFVDRTIVRLVAVVYNVDCSICIRWRRIFAIGLHPVGDIKPMVITNQLTVYFIVSMEYEIKYQGISFSISSNNKLSLALTHWGRVTHICVSKLTIIGSDNGLSPGRRQAIIWVNAGILIIRNKCLWNLQRN